MVLLCSSFGSRSEQPCALQLLIKMLIRLCLMWEALVLLYFVFNDKNKQIWTLEVNKKVFPPPRCWNLWPSCMAILSYQKRVWFLVWKKVFNCKTTSEMTGVVNIRVLQMELGRCSILSCHQVFIIKRTFLVNYFSKIILWVSITEETGGSRFAQKIILFKKNQNKNSKLHVCNPTVRHLRLQ